VGAPGWYSLCKRTQQGYKYKTVNPLVGLAVLLLCFSLPKSCKNKQCFGRIFVYGKSIIPLPRRGLPGAYKSNIFCASYSILPIFLGSHACSIKPGREIQAAIFMVFYPSVIVKK